MTTRPRSVAPRYYNDEAPTMPTFLANLGGFGEVSAYPINPSPAVASIPLIGSNGIADPCPNFTNPIQVGTFANASGFKCNVAGTYLITFQATLSNQGGPIIPRRIDLFAVLNDGFNVVTGSWSNQEFEASGQPGAFQTFTVSKIVPLAVEDIVDFRIQQTSTEVFSVIETTYASFIRLQ